MAFDCFLKIATIPGESSDDKHKEWIEVLSYSHGASQPSSGRTSSSGGHSAGRVDLADFVVTKYLDKSSPKLALACCNGEHIKEISVELCRATGEKGRYMEYKMSDVIVRSVSPAGSGGEQNPLPVEQVAFSFNKIEWTYTEYGADGKKKGDIKTGWDAAANKKV